MMKVFLISNVKGLGKVGDQVMVPRGRARGYLFPNNLAVPVNKNNIENFEQLRTGAEARNASAMQSAERSRDKLNGAVVEFVENASPEDGVLFGSVNSRQIAEKISDSFGIAINHNAVRLPSPIKHVGLHEVEVELHGEVVALVTVNVVANEQNN